MTKKKKKEISSMTKEQEARLPAYLEYWLQVNLHTGPIDRAAAEACIPAVYREQKNEPPQKAFWGRSPYEGLRMAAVLLANPERDFANEAEILSMAGEVTQEHMRSALQLAVFGNQALYWLAFWNWVIEIGGECEADPKPQLELAKNCGWWWPFNDCVVLTEHPIALKRDNQNRLHSINSLALEYSDGEGLASVRGVRVPEEWVLKPLDPQTALTWPNVEQRRAAAEIIGWTKVLESLPFRVIDKDNDPSIGTLIEVDLPDSPKTRFLRVLCGTGREFVLGAPPEAKTALEAQALLAGLQPGEIYAPEVRT